MRAEEVLGKLERVRRSGRGWTARCPAHEDRSPSLSIGEGQNGQVLLHCHSGCTFEEVCEALGVTLKSERRKGPREWIRTVRMAQRVCQEILSEWSERASPWIYDHLWRAAIHAKDALEQINGPEGYYASAPMPLENPQDTLRKRRGRAVLAAARKADWHYERFTEAR